MTTITVGKAFCESIQIGTWLVIEPASSFQRLRIWIICILQWNPCNNFRKIWWLTDRICQIVSIDSNTTITVR